MKQLALAASLLLACSGSSEAEPESSPAPERPASPAPEACEEPVVAAATSEAPELMPPDGGPPSLEEYAERRSAASQTVQVTRRGCPLTIEYGIKSGRR